MHNVMCGSVSQPIQRQPVTTRPPMMFAHTSRRKTTFKALRHRNSPCPSVIAGGRAIPAPISTKVKGTAPLPTNSSTSCTTESRNGSLNGLNAMPSATNNETNNGLMISLTLRAPPRPISTDLVTDFRIDCIDPELFILFTASCGTSATFSSEMRMSPKDDSHSSHAASALSTTAAGAADGGGMALGAVPYRAKAIVQICSNMTIENKMETVAQYASASSRCCSQSTCRFSAMSNG
mmetsp:Transcript_106251/g.307541  ORF Transcript_106251/g.307541 Transcript_106251/m.307541 type:complete len:236 (+) Transcript_106251:250-957(+)